MGGPGSPSEGMVGAQTMLIFPCIPWAEHRYSTFIPVETNPLKPSRGGRLAEVPDLGRAYNEVMAMLPDGGWACLLDHDVMFTTRGWYDQLCQAVAHDSQGTFVPYLSRGGARWQNIQRAFPDTEPDGHDIRYHRELGTRLAQQNGTAYVDVTTYGHQGGGALMLLSKANWQAVGGFPSGCLTTDHDMFARLRRAGRHIYLMSRVYLYHWKRGAGECHPAFVYTDG